MNQRHDPSTTALIPHAYVPYAGFEVPQPPVCKGKLESDPNSPNSHAEFTPVGRSFNMPGGGYEVQFPYAIPPEFIKMVPK